MTHPAVQVDQVDGIAVARVTGEVDLANANAVGRALADASTSGLVVDLAAVTYLDSAGIGELFALAARLRGRGGLAVVVPDTSPLQRLFKITQFEEAAPVYPSDADAVRALNRGRRER